MANKKKTTRRAASKTREAGSAIEVDPKKAREAYEALEPTLKAIPPERLIAVRVDAQRAALHTFGIAERDRAEERSKAFAKLVKGGVIAPNPCDRLAQLALATWHARQQQLRYVARSGFIVPAAITEAGASIKRRMLKLVTYAFGEHPKYAAEIDAIRQGSGYQDLANDLQQLADLYEDEEISAVIVRDPVNYQESDPDDARTHAASIFRALGFENADAAQWTARVQRAYTALDDTYAEHCHAGALLFFRVEDVSVTYPPSLVSVVRASPTKPDVQLPEALDPPVPTDPAPTQG